MGHKLAQALADAEALALLETDVEAIAPDAPDAPDAPADTLTEAPEAPEASHIMESGVMDFNTPAVKYIGKNEIITTGLADVYVKIGVHLIDSQIAVLTGNGMQATRIVTQALDRIIVKVTRLSYGESDAQQASALKGYTRISESKDEIYCAVYRDSAGMMRVDGFLNWNNKEKSFEYTRKFAGLELTQTDKDHFASLCNKHMLRVERNESMRDSRYVTVKGKKLPIGLFASMKAQTVK